MSRPPYKLPDMKNLVECLSTIPDEKLRKALTEAYSALVEAKVNSVMRDLYNFLLSTGDWAVDNGGKHVSDQAGHVHERIGCGGRFRSASDSDLCGVPVQGGGRVDGRDCGDVSRCHLGGG